jgi:hypothetical protein
MSDDYEKYEIECKKITKANEKLLIEFAEWLKAANLKEKTIDNHVSNVDLYINDYLLYDGAKKAKEGVDCVSSFLGYWFIKKAMWASPAHIRGNAASLKKFYTFMQEKKQISKKALDDMNETIKEEMPEWLATMDRYDDPYIENMEDVWRY